MKVECLKANIDFPSNDTFRITTPYRQKIFTARDVMWVDLEKLVELECSSSGIGFTHKSHLYMSVASYVRSLSSKFAYCVRALTGGDNKYSRIADFFHNEPSKINIKIYR